MSCLFIENKAYFLSVCVDDIKMAAKKRNMASHSEEVDERRTTPFLDHVYLGCTQRECKPNETVIEAKLGSA